MPIGPGALPQPQRRGAPEAAFESVLELVIDPGGFRDLISGALDAGAVSILAGDAEAVVRFTRTFRIDPVGPTTDATAGAGGAEASVA